MGTLLVSKLDLANFAGNILAENCFCKQRKSPLCKIVREKDDRGKTEDELQKSWWGGQEVLIYI